MSNDNSKLTGNKAPYDPGWNDPPMFSYSATPPSATGKSKLNLNKRVAFPLQSSIHNDTTKTPLASSGLPLPFSGSIVTPPTNFTPPPPSISSNILPPPTILLNQPVVENKEIALIPPIHTNEAERHSYIIATLDRTITSLSSANNTSEFKEIIKRIEILKSAYDKLDHKIQSILYSIANSIDKKNIPEATNFHRSLVVDYLNVCSQWAPALRQLILLGQPPNEIIEQQQTENQVPLYNNNLSSEYNITTGMPISSDSQDNVQNSTAVKNNFSKIYHI